jgi:hypothetical protein
MRRYYWAAKAVSQLSQILLLNIEERLNPLDPRNRGPSTRAFSTKAASSRWPATTCTSATRTRFWKPFCSTRRLAGLQESFGAHAACAVQRARRDGQRLPARPGQPRRLHAHPAAALGHHPCHAADEPDLGAGALPVAVSPHRRADAARPVPCLHGGPAHPDGAAQHAALLHGRACARIPVLLAACRWLGQALGAVMWRRCSTTSARGAAATIRRSAPWRCGAFAASMAWTREDARLIEFLVREHLTMSTWHKSRT